MKGIIFDLDGTLVDSLPALAASLNRSLQHYGLATHSEKQIEIFIGNGAEILVHKALGNEAENHFQKVLNFFKLDYAKTWNEGTIIYEGIFDCLQKLMLAGKKLAVLSNKPHQFTVEIVKQLFPQINFLIVLGQRSGIPHKPDPLGLNEIFDEFNFTAADCVMVGDSFVDMVTAKRAGCHALGVNWGYQSEEELKKGGADDLVDNIQDLTLFLLR
jgi:phosphoglycolate phosphatase